MKKLIAFSKDRAIKFTAKLGDVVDNIFSRGVPFVPPPVMTFHPPVINRTADEHLRMMGAQRASVLESYAMQQAGMMGGFGGQLLAQLMGSGVHPYETSRVAGFTNSLQEGKVSVHVKFTRIDKEHVLVEVDCIQRIVHNAKELKEVTADLIEQYAEGYIFGEQPKSSREPVAREPVAKEPPGGIEGTDEKKA